MNSDTLILFLIAMTLGGVLALAISHFITFQRTKRHDHSHLTDADIRDRTN